MLVMNAPIASERKKVGKKVYDAKFRPDSNAVQEKRSKQQF